MGLHRLSRPPSAGGRGDRLRRRQPAGRGGAGQARRQPAHPLPLSGHFSGNSGAAGHHAPAALYQGPAGGSGAVSDRLFQKQRLCRRPHCRTALYAGAAGVHSAQGGGHRPHHPACGAGHLPPGEGGRDHRPCDAYGAVSGLGGRRGADQCGPGPGRPGHLRGHHLLPHHRDGHRRSPYHPPGLRRHRYFYLPGLYLPGHGRTDHQFSPAGEHADHAGLRLQHPGDRPAGL